MTWRPGHQVVLETDRFELRSATREDVQDDLMTWLSDGEVMIGLNLPRQRLSRAQMVQYVLSHDNRTRFMVMVRERTTGQRIGVFTVALDPAHGVAETAVVIGDRAWWGQGVVIEARSALLDFLFDVVGIHKVMGRPHGRNVASIFSYKAMGFRCEGVLRGQMRAITDEGRLDQLVFGLLAEEWRGA